MWRSWSRMTSGWRISSPGKFPDWIASPDALLVHADAFAVDGEGEVFSVRCNPRYTHAPTPGSCATTHFASITSFWLMRRSVIKDYGGFVEAVGRHWGGRLASHAEGMPSAFTRAARAS
jgi:hypothetical protein